MTHQIFISYRHSDREVATKLRTILESNGVRCWMDVEEISLGTPWDEEILRAIAESRLMLLLITPGSIESPREQKREVGVAAKYEVLVVPVYRVPPTVATCFDYVLGDTQYFDASGEPILDRLEAAAQEIRKLLASIELQRLKKAERARQTMPAPAETSESATPDPPQPTGAPSVKTGKSVAMLYRRDIPQDEELLQRIVQRLTERGHTVFVDKQLPVGGEWRRTIREKVENADAVIPLLSLFSLGSEMLEEEIQIAHRAAQLSGGRPRILPVRVNYEGALPSVMGQCLQRLQYRLWRGPDDNEPLVNALIEEVERPSPPPPTVAQQIEMPTGAVPLTSPFYIIRAGDRLFQTGIARGESIMLVRGARQMGKTSLIARGLKQAREKGVRAASTDFQTLNEQDFQTLKNFYCALAGLLAEELNLDASLAADWNPDAAANVNFQRFILRRVLAGSDQPVVWALDEVDRLFPQSYSTDVFGLFRSWFNARAINPGKGWEKLTLVIGYATEASLFIRDVNMSPFNVGLYVDMADFTPEEVTELNARYGHPLENDGAIARLMERVGGQPFLVRRSLYALAVEGEELDNLLAHSASDDGVFGDHLRRFRFSLQCDADLDRAVRGFLQRGRELSQEQFYRLRSAGLVVGAARQDARIRCGIYRDYLAEKLG